MLADHLDCLSGSGFGVGQREDFAGKIPREAEGLQGRDDRGGLRVAEADGPTITVGEMDMADMAAAGAQSLCIGDFLDVHVEQVAEQLDVIRLQRLEELSRIQLAVEQIGFVAIQGLVKERHAVLLGMGAQVFQRFGEPGERLLAGDIAFGLALHRADDGRRLELATEVDNGPDEFTGLSADLRVGVRQVPFMDKPAAAGAEGCHDEPMLLQQGVERGAIDRSRRRGKNLDRVKPEPRGGGRGGVESVPINERSALSLGDE